MLPALFSRRDQARLPRAAADEAPPSPEAPSAPSPGPVGLLVLAAWLALLAGYFELGRFVTTAGGPDPLTVYFGRSRHYPWMIPLVQLGFMMLVAVPLALVRWRWPRLGARIGPVAVAALAVLTPLILTIGGLHDAAALILALGLGSAIVGMLRSSERLVRRLVLVTLPLMVLGLPVLAVLAIRRDGAPPPARHAAPADAPNVLLIVMDTVRADHLSLYGYPRPTSPNLERLARRGVNYTRARAAAPWTLPSHASLFTGRWPTSLSADWYAPLDDAAPTLAGALAARGYDTAGFAANLNYCSYFTGLDRGFARFEDFPLTPYWALRATLLGTRLLSQIDYFGKKYGLIDPADVARRSRVTADEINGRLLRWLDDRGGDDRPFFAFLNYFDAHDPYLPPSGFDPGFVQPPKSAAEREMLVEWWPIPNKNEAAPEEVRVVVDAYDACLAYLDDRIGRLIDDLGRRGLLDDTLVIITADHGELLGDHGGLYGHGASLYDGELRVPLIVMAPGMPAGAVVDEPVSLRALPSTVGALAGLDDLPFQAVPLAPLRPNGAAPRGVGPSLASIIAPSRYNANHGRSPVFSGPQLGIIDENRYKLIVTLTNPPGLQLFDLTADPTERRNLAFDPASRPILDGLRSRLQFELSGSTMSIGGL